MVAWAACKDPGRHCAPPVGAPAACSSQQAGCTPCGCVWQLDETPATRLRQRRRLPAGRPLLRPAAAASCCSAASAGRPAAAAGQPRFASIAAAHAPSAGKRLSADGLQAVPAAVMEGKPGRHGMGCWLAHAASCALLQQGAAAVTVYRCTTVPCRRAQEAVCVGRAAAAGAGARGLGAGGLANFCCLAARLLGSPWFLHTQPAEVLPLPSAHPPATNRHPT